LASHSKLNERKCFSLTLEAHPLRITPEEIIAKLRNILDILSCEDKLVQGATAVAVKKNCLIKILPIISRTPYTSQISLPQTATVLRIEILCIDPNDLVHVAKIIANRFKSQGFNIRIFE